MLNHHQIEAVEKLSNGKILCGGVGSGKSRTALAYFITKECGGSVDPLNRYEITKSKDLYIITTAKKRNSLDWLKECALFGISTNQDDNPLGISVQIDSWNNLKKYVGVKDSFFIFDEQRLVGYGAWVKAFLKISKDNHWILLSATPGDTWMDYLPVFLANGFYRNKTEFIEEHVIYAHHTNFPKILKYVKQGVLQRNRDALLVDLPVDRHTVRQWKRHNLPYDSALMDKVWKERWNPFSDEPIRTVSELFYLMRKVANTHESRLESILELLRGTPRLIVFYNFDYELDILRSLSDVTTVAEWNGHKHEEVPTCDSWVYLVQYQAGAEAWNCITTDTIVFYSLNYSYRMLEQAAGRIDRMNTPYVNLKYHILMSSSQIDLAIWQAVQSKKTFNERKSKLAAGFLRDHRVENK